MRVLGTSIEASGGVVPADGVIQVAFDRYLLPATITRQSFAIVDTQNQLISGLTPKSTYDPVARTVTIFGPDGPGRSWLTPDGLYKLVLLVPEDPASDIGGYRAIDRTPLSSRQKLQYVFRAGPPTGATTFEPAVDFCTDVLPIFVGKCGGSLCHGTSASAASSLVLTSAAGVRTTAIGRVAHGSNVDAHASVVTPTPSHFGGNMAIIEPGDPGSSWLTYKIELASPRADTGPRPDLECFPIGSPARPPAADFVPLASAAPYASSAERERLAQFILGREMPYPYPASAYVPPTATSSNASPTTWYVAPLDFQERQRVRLWIARGAETYDCGSCETP